MAGQQYEVWVWPLPSTIASGLAWTIVVFKVGQIPANKPAGAKKLGTTTLENEQSKYE